MAMNFNRPAGAPTTAVAAKPETALMEVQPYDIIADQQATQKQLAHSPEIESLTAAIDVNDLNTIVTFGNHSAEEISKASDVVLRSMNMSQLDESSKMLNSLAKSWISLISTRFVKIRRCLASCSETCASSWTRFWRSTTRWATRWTKSTSS